MDRLFTVTPIEGITLGAGEVARGGSHMDVDRIGEVGDRASQGQTGFTVGPLASKEARGRTRGTGSKVSSIKELMEIGAGTMNSLH